MAKAVAKKKPVKKAAVKKAMAKKPAKVSPVPPGYRTVTAYLTVKDGGAAIVAGNEKVIAARDDREREAQRKPTIGQRAGGARPRH